MLTYIMQSCNIKERSTDHINQVYCTHKANDVMLKDENLFELYEAYNLSLVLRKPAFCICENKDADQLRGNREADQRLCFRYTDSTIPLFPKP